jgi:hypothetical protein
MLGNGIPEDPMFTVGFIWRIPARLNSLGLGRSRSLVGYCIMSTKWSTSTGE